MENPLFINIYNSNCITENTIEDNSIDLLICDPPFGIGEKDFEKHYKRSKKTLTDNYQEAPDNYEICTYEWLSVAKQKMKENATLYLVSGLSNLKEVLNSKSLYLGMEIPNWPPENIAELSKKLEENT